MSLQFSRATKRKAKLRMALLGGAGSGKTFSALQIGRALVGPEARIALMDTEHGSASKYADLWQFDSVEPSDFSVETYLQVIQAAEQGGYDLLILDSLSHAWAGKGGLLEFVDNQAKRNSSGNTFGAWRDATPKHNALVEAMIGAKCHLIVTMRVKMEYVQERDDRGKTTIRKVGLQPVQRDGLEYEFDVVGDLTAENELVITKTRCPALKGQVYPTPGENIAAPLRAWLEGGAEAPAEPPKPSPASPNGHVPTQPTPHVQPSPASLATPAQVRAIYSLGKEQNDLSEPEVDQHAVKLYGVPATDLDRKQASEFIAWLKGQKPPTSADHTAEAKAKPVSMNDWRKLVDDCLPLGIPEPRLPPEITPSDLGVRYAHLQAMKGYYEAAGEAQDIGIKVPDLPEKVTRRDLLQLTEVLRAQITDKREAAPGPETYEGEVPEDESVSV